MPSFRGTALKGSVRLAKKMSRSASLKPVQQFIANCTYLNENHKCDIYSDQSSLRARGFDAETVHRSAFSRVANAAFLNQMLYVDTKIFMTSLNLTYNDKMSMASSVEVRVPFLDRELAEFVAWNVPPELKLKGSLNPTTKYIFRKAMRDLPREVLQQPKAGFAAPVDYWLAHDLKDMVDDLLSSAKIKQRGLFKVEAVRRFVEEQRMGRQDWSLQIWQFLTLELWMQTFLDGGAQKFEAEAFQISQVATA